MRLDGIVLPDRTRLREVIADILKGRGGGLLYLSLLGLLAGFLAIGCIFLLGHAHTTNTSDLVPWGIQITTYVYFVLISTGCTFVNFFGRVFYEEDYKPFASRVIFLGIVTALAAFLSLAAEMGRIERMYYFLVSPNPASPMFWMSVWYLAYLAVIVLEYINIRRNRHSQAVVWGAFLIAVVTHSTLGSLFGAVGPRAYYYSALLPIYFLFIAFLTGSALSAVVAAVEWRKTPGDDSPLPAFFTTFLKIGLGLALLANFWRLMIGLAGHGPGWEVFRLTLFDSLFHGIFLAVVVPFLLSLVIRGPGGMIVTGLLILATQFKARSDLVAGGFKVPVFRAYDIPAVVQYTPSIFEVLVLVASVSLVSFLYLVCDRSGLFEPIPGKEA
jgi:molybdopterin-containing oxidoreductase family membrane subunit